MQRVFPVEANNPEMAIQKSRVGEQEGDIHIASGATNYCIQIERVNSVPAGQIWAPGNFVRPLETLQILGMVRTFLLIRKRQKYLPPHTKESSHTLMLWPFDLVLCAMPQLYLKQPLEQDRARLLPKVQPQ